MWVDWGVDVKARCDDPMLRRRVDIWVDTFFSLYRFNPHFFTLMEMLCGDRMF